MRPFAELGASTTTLGHVRTAFAIRNQVEERHSRRLLEANRVSQMRCREASMASATGPESKAGLMHILAHQATWVVPCAVDIAADHAACMGVRFMQMYFEDALLSS
jgi:hypothetical protein